MRCSEFRDQHCAFIDDTLAGVELIRMQRHLGECPDCAALDARIRRSLMLARSLPQVEPSANFRHRLEARLQAYKERPEATACANFKIVATFGAAASLVMLGYMAESLHRVGVPRDIVLPPVVAMAEPPELPREPAAATATTPPASAIIASVSAGMPIWPAALFAEQAPLHFVSYTTELH